MGFFDFLKGPATRIYTGKPIQRALKPWLSEVKQGRIEISPEGRYKHQWVKLEPQGETVRVSTFDGDDVGHINSDMPECAEVVAIIKQAQIHAATVCCYDDEDSNKDGWRAILTLGPHRFQPRMPFKRAKEINVTID